MTLSSYSFPSQKIIPIVMDT